VGRGCQVGWVNGINLAVMKGVIWDMDGVLVDSAPFHFEAWKKIWEEKGIPFSFEDFKKIFGMRNDAIIRYFLGENVSLEEIEEIGRRKEEYFRSMAKGRISPQEGLVELLEALREEGFKHAVASSGPRENVEFVVKELGILSFFEVLIAGEDVSHSKPHPEIFLKASERLGIPPARCIVVEDSPAGIEGAKRAGMKCIAVVGKEGRTEGGDLIVKDFCGLKPEDFLRLLSLDSCK